MKENKDKLRIQLADICHRLYDKGFVTATDGNVSVRLDNRNFLTTRTSINKGIVTAEDLVEVDTQGHPTTQNPKLKPSTELPMHLYIYSQRPDVNAVVHAHPTYATGFALARQPLNECLFPEVIVGLGAVPLANYATPSTEEVAQSLAPYVKNADAILLANHGVVTYGKDLWDAYFKMEKVEHVAHIAFVARMLGGEQPLTAEQVEKLRTISQKAYGKDFSQKVACEPARANESNSAHVPTDEEIREVVKKMLNS